MSIRLIVDSASDITTEIADKYNIMVIPVTVSFSDGDYRDKIDININELYTKVNQLNEMPKTAQITPNVFFDILEEELKTYDEVLLITMGSKYSGTYNSAILTKNMLNNERLHIVDSESITLGYGHLVYEAASIIAKGASIQEALERIDYCKKHKVTFALFDTLEYLKKGGRLSAPQAFIGNILNVKLIVQIKEELSPMNKSRGMRKALGWVMDYIRENNIELKDKEVLLINAAGEDTMMAMKEMLEQEFGVSKFIYLDMGAVVGTHGGPGAIGLSFLKD